MRTIVKHALFWGWDLFELAVLAVVIGAIMMAGSAYNDIRHAHKAHVVKEARAYSGDGRG